MLSIFFQRHEAWVDRIWPSRDAVDNGFGLLLELGVGRIEPRGQRCCQGCIVLAFVFILDCSGFVLAGRLAALVCIASVAILGRRGFIPGSTSRLALGRRVSVCCIGGIIRLILSLDRVVIAHRNSRAAHSEHDGGSEAVVVKVNWNVLTLVLQRSAGELSLDACGPLDWAVLEGLVDVSVGADASLRQLAGVATGLEVNRTSVDASAGLNGGDVRHLGLANDEILLALAGLEAAFLHEETEAPFERVLGFLEFLESEVMLLADVIRKELTFEEGLVAFLLGGSVTSAEKGSAVVGSSNLTLAGFTGNTELNVRVTGDAEMDALRDWFDALWKDSEDVSGELVTELERSWVLAETPPYHVYLKALYELYSSEIGEGELPLRPRPELANFQRDAVRRGLAIIESHGGCYVGDVVGLGKTFVGAELLRQLRVSYPNDGPPLILCPAGLKPMWERFNELFQLGAAVVSHSVIRSAPDTEFDEETGRYVDAEAPGHGVDLQSAYPGRGPVLVDEAHNFRNVNQRSEGLCQYLAGAEHKVVLMSATPQNLGPMDIYRQLVLFLDDTDHGLNIEPANLEQYFHNALRWMEYRAEYENYQAEFDAWSHQESKSAPPLPPPRPNVPQAKIEQVLSPVFIRRRRKDLRELYGDTAEVGGKPVRFPDPVLDNVQYRLDKVYAKAGSFDDLQAMLARHRGFRYRATDYIKPEAQKRQEYRDLFRARDRIARLIGVLLLKRLESSIEAFRSTLESLLRSNRNFREALDAGFVPIGGTATSLLSGQSFDTDELLDVLRQEEQRRLQLGGKNAKLIHDAADFETARWADDLDADADLLNALLDRVRNIGPDDDDKLQTLRAFLNRPEVRDGKLLLFSEAETTIEYLFQQLNPDGKDPSIARLTGATSSSAENVIRRFSPASNLGQRERLPGPEIRVLLATDVVSEGQNLQDCARVLNYDLHWNPVRLVQRFGRVDRIGTEHSVINLHNMWPDQEVDVELSLTERLHRRIQSFHDVIGLDSKLLSNSERINASAMYSIYDNKQLPEIDDGLDEVAANQRAVALLQRILDDDPKLWRTITTLPDGIRSALQVGLVQADAVDESYAQNVLAIEGSQAPLISPSLQAAVPSPFDDPRQGETLVLLSAAGIPGCYAVGANLNPRPISPAQFIAAAKCDENTPAEPLPEATNERVMKAFDTFKADFRGRLGKARRPRNTLARRYASKQLSITIREAGGNAPEAARLDVLRRIFQADLPPQVESALGEIRTLQLGGSLLRTRLEALRERHRLNPPTDADEPQEPQIIRIVCSDGLV